MNLICTLSGVQSMEGLMGFKAVKHKVITCLHTGMVYHEQRSNIDVKNLFAIGLLDAQHIAQIIAHASGNEYSSSPHHFDHSVEVHVIKTTYAGFAWYIKWYFREDNSVFISVHHRGA